MKKTLVSLLLLSCLSTVNLLAGYIAPPAIVPEWERLTAPAPILGNYQKAAYNFYPRAVALLDNSDIPEKIKSIISDIPDKNITYSLMTAIVPKNTPINTIFHGFLQKVTGLTNVNKIVKMGLFYSKGINGIDMPIGKLKGMSVNFHNSACISPNNAKFKMTADDADFWAIAVYDKNAMVCHTRLTTGNTGLIEGIEAMYNSDVAE